MAYVDTFSFKQMNVLTPQFSSQNNVHSKRIEFTFQIDVWDNSEKKSTFSMPIILSRVVNWVHFTVGGNKIDEDIAQPYQSFK